MFRYLMLPSFLRDSSILRSFCRLISVLLILLLLSGITSAAIPAPLSGVIAPLIEAHPGRSSAYVLEKGEEALRARAWLADHATSSIDVQYFIWSSDNIGILASEALLRAAERGVKVRVLVDDLLIDAPPDSMLALALHPNIDIRIYNPRLNVGTSKLRKMFEFKPDPAIKRELIESYPKLEQQAPLFAIHAKSMVIDGATLFVGTFNFDPRSEVGVLIRNSVLAGQVEKNIVMDMSPENSWSAADNADRFAPPEKLRKVKLWKTLPLEPFL